VTTIRPFNTFGPRQSTRAVIPTIITQALTGNKVKLGSLTPVRDLTYVADTVSGFIKFAESKKTIGRTVNTGSGRGVTIGELANIIIKKVNPKAKIVCEQKRIRPGKSEVMELLCDNRLAGELAGWNPSYTLENGLDLTIGWMKEHLASYKTGVYTV
jgi:nucleoside-diphosphate-sugar epimerase